MARTPRTRTDRFTMDPIGLGALVGGIVAFVATGALIDLLWVALGLAIGGAVGFGVHLLLKGRNERKDTIDLTEGATRSELYDQAKALDVPKRSDMTKDQLAEAVRKAS